MNVELMSVGTELLLGDIVNTNTAYLSKELANIGINVYKHTTVGDNRDRLLRSLERAFEYADIVIITGGLGPTDDDITKECAAKYFEKDFYLDDYSWKKIKNYVQKYNKNNVITMNNQKQALIPEGAIILENFCGTAPGIIIEENNKAIILMPGPPSEMRDMFRKSVKPYLEKLSNKKFVSKYLRFYGIGESLLEDKIKDILDNQDNPTVALYAKPGEVLIRVTANGDNLEICNDLVEYKIKEINSIVGEYIYLIGDENVADSTSELHKVVAQKLLSTKTTIALAESLTGGHLTSLLVENSGISAVLKESMVCYSNKAKEKYLNVSEETIEKYGVVSEQVAYEMVAGLQLISEADIVISTTGYAEKNELLSDEQVGLAYIGIGYKGQIHVKECRFNGDRNRIRDRVAKEALSYINKLFVN